MKLKFINFTSVHLDNEVLKMKSKIKALTGKFVLMNFKIKGWKHHMTGIIKNPKIVQFDFLVNKSVKRKVRYENVMSVEEIES